MSDQYPNQSRSAATAQAPAMIALTSNVGPFTDETQPQVLHLKMAVSRHDIATVELRADKEILVSYEDVTQTPVDYQDIPEQDLVAVFRAVDVLREHLSRPKKTSGVDITIQKHIPFSTSLGARAASAAAVLVALAHLWDAKLVREDLVKLAARIDDGVAEAITGGLVMTNHFGSEPILTQVLTRHDLGLVIVPAAADISVDEPLATLRDLRASQPDELNPDRLAVDQALLEALAQGDIDEVALMMHNDFQPAVVNLLPEHHDWLTAGMTEGALAAQTIGSGASLLFLARDLHDAQEIADRFEERMEIAAIAEHGPVGGAHLVS